MNTPAFRSPGPAVPHQSKSLSIFEGQRDPSQHPFSSFVQSHGFFRNSSVPMKSSLVLALGTAFFLTACGGTSMMLNRGKVQYIRHNDVSAKDSSHIMNGEIYRGMPVRHAIATLGEPLKTDTLNWEERRQLKITYRAQPNSSGGHLDRASVYAANNKVTRWEDLDKIPRFDAYYRPGN